MQHLVAHMKTLLQDVESDLSVKVECMYRELSHLIDVWKVSKLSEAPDQLLCGEIQLLWSHVTDTDTVNTV